MITVIIPVYNAEQYLPQCLDSVVSQTYKDLEIICINDGSIDRSNVILNTYAARDPRFTVLHLPHNLGQHSAGPINMGLAAAKGDYITWVSADDYMASNDVLERQLKVLTEKCVDMVAFSYEQIGHNPHKVIVPEGKITLDMIKANNCVCASFLFKKEVLHRVGYMRTDLVGVDDWEYWYRVVKVADVYKTSDIGICWRSHGQNMTTQKTQECQANLNRLKKEML